MPVVGYGASILLGYSKRAKGVQVRNAIGEGRRGCLGREVKHCHTDICGGSAQWETLLRVASLVMRLVLCSKASPVSGTTGFKAMEELIAVLHFL